MAKKDRCSWCPDDHSAPVSPTVQTKYSKADGPDKIPTRFLKDYADDISKFLKIIFHNSYSTGDRTQDWLTADVIPIFKKGGEKPSLNYKPHSHHLQTTNGTHHTHIIRHCDSQNKLQNCQHGFKKQHSCESQLIINTEELKRSIDQKKQVEIIILDFSKAFDSVAHNKLVSKLQNYGLQGKKNK